jgi:hypothetical protein
VLRVARCGLRVAGCALRVARCGVQQLGFRCQLPAKAIAGLIEEKLINVEHRITPWHEMTNIEYCILSTLELYILPSDFQILKPYLIDKVPFSMRVDALGQRRR